jgi:hypothetical protein
MLRRAGLRTMPLSPVIDPSRMRRAVRVLAPSAIVVTATTPSLDAIGRLIYAVRGAEPSVTVFEYRGTVPDGGASAVFRLGTRPLAARDGLVARLDSRARAAAVPARARMIAAGVR